LRDAIYITASSVISRHRVFKNGQLLFEKKDNDLPGFLIAAYRHFGINYPKFYKMDNLAKLGWLASDVLLKDNFEITKYKREEIGILFSNASSSLDTDLKYFQSTKVMASPALFVYTLPNIVIGEICIRHKIKGEGAFFIFDAFDPEFIEKYVSDLVKNNILQACICGWVELIGEEYKAVLYLVEKERGQARQLLPPDPLEAMVFTKENLNKIYYLQNG
jgi:hypothetical protein